MQARKNEGMHSKHIHIGCTQREHGRRKITCTRYRDRRRSLRAWEKAIGRALCVSLEAIDPTPGRLRSSDACVCTIRSIAPVHRHANSTRPHRGIVQHKHTQHEHPAHKRTAQVPHRARAHASGSRNPQQQSAHTHTGTPNAQHGARRRALRVYRHGTSCAQSASAHGMRTWRGRAPPLDVRRTCTAATVMALRRCAAARPRTAKPMRSADVAPRRARDRRTAHQHRLRGARGPAAPSPSISARHGLLLGL